jgi:hypothetical protein
VTIEAPVVPQVRIAEAQGMNTGQFLTVSGCGYVIPDLTIKQWEYLKFEGEGRIYDQYWSDVAKSNTDADPDGVRVYASIERVKREQNPSKRMRHEDVVVVSQMKR